MRAVATGKVVFARKDPDKFGNLVVIEHGDGWHSAYGSLDRITVKEGGAVAKGERAIVVGAGKDVGRELALGLAGEGARVVLAGRKHDPLAEAAAMIDALGGEAHVVAVDLHDPQGADSLADRVRTLLGGVDLVSNTAGVFPTSRLGANSSRDYRRMTGQFGALKAALAHVVKYWAREGGAAGVRFNAVHPGWIKGVGVAAQVASAAAAAGVSFEEQEHA